MERYLHLLKMHLGVTGTIEGRGEGGQEGEAGGGKQVGRGEKATLSHRLPLLLKGNGGTATLHFRDPAVYTCKHFIVTICTIKMLCSNYKYLSTSSITFVGITIYTSILFVF